MSSVHVECLQHCAPKTVDAHETTKNRQIFPFPQALDAKISKVIRCAVRGTFLGRMNELQGIFRGAADQQRSVKLKIGPEKNEG